ncbi:MAG: hypothetical protein ABIW76_07085 [Fibrobacteria bacterium]
MISLTIRDFCRSLALALLLACLGSAEAAKKKAKPTIPLVSPATTENKYKQARQEKPGGPAASVAIPPQPGSDKPGNTFQELNFNRTLVIEGKVEKPAVQFTLLKEPPPEKEIRFETSFMQNILKLERENTFKSGETYGRE